MAEDIVRVMRIIIYEGSREWIEKTIGNSVHGTKVMSSGAKITAQTINEFPEIIKQHELEQ